jgi:hypothetical protein
MTGTYNDVEVSRLTRDVKIEKKTKKTK